MHKLQRGFVSGIALALTVALISLLAVHFTKAQGFDSANDAANGNASATTATDSSTPFSVSSSTAPTNFANSSATGSTAANGPFSGGTSAPAGLLSPTTPNSGSYAAMGDSVGAGLGLPLSPSASARDKQCGRSPQGYPQLVANALGKPLTNVTCSGATAGDLFTKQGVSGPNIPSQISQAYANGKPGIITITAGANDTQWANFIKKCYAGTCGTATDTTIVNGFLSVLQAKLFLMFADLKLHAAGSTAPQVLVTGYYNPVSANCSAAAPQLTASELAWINNDVKALNQTLQDVTSRFSFARFVPVDFSGHDLCSATPWVQGLNDPAPIHPNAAGQQAIAQAVIAAAKR